MQATQNLPQLPPAEQPLETFAKGLRDMARALEQFVFEPEPEGDYGDVSEETPHWSESAEWQDHLSQFEDKGVLR